MNKLLFDANGDVIQGPYTVAGHYQYEQEYEGKKSVLSFIRKGDSLIIPESQINFDGESDYLEFNFRVDTPPEKETGIVSGKAIPFTLSCLAGEKGLMLHARLVTVHNDKKYIRECESSIPLEYAVWYNFKIILIHEEYCVLVDDQPHMRRIYKGAWKTDYTPQNLVFCGGEQTGLHLCDIAFSENIFEEATADSISATLQRMNDSDYMEVDSCIRDCALDGIVLQGFCARTKIDGKFCWVYENGAIVFDYEDKAIYLPPALLKSYQSNTRDLGRPVAYTSYTCEDDGSEIQFGLFTNGGLFYNVTKDERIFLKGDILKRFLDSDLKINHFWYPVDSGHYDNPVRIDFTVFSNGLVIYAFDAQTVLLPCSFHDYLWQDNKLLRKTGLPLSDYRIGVNAKGEKCYEALECQNGTIHSTDSFECFFSDRKLGKAVKLDGKKEDPDGETIHYYDFENGVIVLYPGQNTPVVYESLLLTLSKVTAGEINDAINKTPELFLKFTLIQDKKKIVDKKRLGSDDYLHASSNYVWTDDRMFKISPLQGNSYFRLKIDLYDYDPESSADYLGTFDYTFSIENGWGLESGDEDGNPKPQVCTLPMTEGGKDNRHGLYNNMLVLTLSEAFDRSEMMKDIMKNYTLPFKNFTGSYLFTPDDFTRVFSNVNKWGSVFSCLEHPIDAFFYFACLVALDGAKCFGFATSEVLAIHDLSHFTPPLYKYSAPEGFSPNETYAKLGPEYGKPICDYYLYQLGWDAIMWGWKKMNAGEYLTAHNSIEGIIKCLDQDKCCLLCMLPPKMLDAHAVMAYGYKQIKPEERDGNGYYTYIDKNGKETKIKADYDYLIYIADCNYPQQSPEEKVSCFISFEKESRRTDRVRVYWTKDREITDSDAYSKEGFKYLYMTPVSILSRPPRVPNFLDLTIETFTTMVCGWFSCAADSIQITDPDTDEVLYDPENDVLKTDRIMVRPNMAADGKDSPTLFVLKGNNLNVKFRGAKKQDLDLRIAGREACASFKTGLAKGEELGFTFRNVHRPDRFTAAIHPSFAHKAVQTEISFADRRDKSQRHVFKEGLVIDKGGTKLASLCVGARMKVNDTVIKAAQERIEVPISRARRIEMRRDYPGATVMNRNLTTTQISALYHIGKSTARAYCRQGLIPEARKANKRWSIPSENNAVK